MPSCLHAARACVCVCVACLLLFLWPHQRPCLEGWRSTFPSRLGPQAEAQPIASLLVVQQTNTLGNAHYPQAAGHGTLVPELMRQLQQEGMEHVLVVVGGIIPTQVRCATLCMLCCAAMRCGKWQCWGMACFMCDAALLQHTALGGPAALRQRGSPASAATRGVLRLNN